MSSCTLLVLLLLAARPAAADIVPDQGGRLLFLGIHPEGDGVPWELAGAVEQAVLQELSRNGPSTVLSAVGAGPGEGRPSRPGEVLHQAEKQLEKGLSCFRAAQLEEASELLVAAFAAFLEQLPYLSDPLLLARAGLHLALVQQAAGRLDEAEQIVDQLVQLGLGRELPEEELPSSLRTILARSRRRLTVQPGVMVQLATRPAGALIFLDGHYQGRTPWRGVQPPGRHWLRLEKPGFLPQYHSIELEAGPGKLRKIDVDLRRGQLRGGATTLLALRAGGAGAAEQEEEILHQAELVGARATVVGFLRSAGAQQWTLLLGLYRSERSVVLGLRELRIGQDRLDVADFGEWVVRALQAAPAPPAAELHGSFYRCAGAEDWGALEQLRNRKGAGAVATAERPASFPVFFGLGTGLGWGQQDDELRLSVTPLVLDLQLHLPLSPRWALGLDGRGLLPPFEVLLEPQLRHRQPLGQLDLHLFAGLPATSLVRAFQGLTGAEREGSRWIGLALGAAVFRGWSPRWSPGLQVHAATWFPTFSFQLDLVLGALAF